MALTNSAGAEHEERPLATWDFALRAARLHEALTLASGLVTGLDEDERSEFLGYVQAEQASRVSYAFITAVDGAMSDPASADYLALCAAGLDDEPAAPRDDRDPWTA